MSNSPKQQNNLRTFINLPVKVLGLLMFHPVMLIFRLMGIKRPPGRNTPEAYQFLGLLTLFITAIILFVIWGGWKLLAILILHTWAMLIFSKIESYLRLNISEIWRRIMVIIQIGFIITLALIDFRISLPIIVSYLIIAKVSSILIFENLQLYTRLLTQDRFDAYYWWRRKHKSPRNWEKTFQILVKKQFYQSMAEIIKQYLLEFQEEKEQLKYTPVILQGWILLRKHQILPNDFILTQFSKSSKKTSNVSPNTIIGYSCNFDVMRILIAFSNERTAYSRLLKEFLLRLQSDLEQYIHKPSSLTVKRLQEPNFEQQLDRFLEQQTKIIEDKETLELFEYCYGLFYVASGISKNV